MRWWTEARARWGFPTRYEMGRMAEVAADVEGADADDEAYLAGVADALAWATTRGGEGLGGWQSDALDARLRADAGFDEQGRHFTETGDGEDDDGVGQSAA